MATIPELKKQYEDLDQRLVLKEEAAIDTGCLLAFQYDYPEQDSVIDIDTEEFTALCPWTGLQDYGTLEISYVPDRSCIELKSLKYYLMSFRNVGIVQEHSANRILKDLAAAVQPRYMKVTLDYRIRGGIHACVSVEYPGGEHQGSGHAPDTD